MGGEVPGIGGDEDEADETPEPQASKTQSSTATDPAKINADETGDELPKAELRDQPAEERHDDQPAEEPDVAEVELREDDFDGGGGLFDDVEDADDDPDTDDGDEGDGDPLDALDDRGEALEGAINEGFARLGVAGLPDDEQDDLEGEFTEIFEAFRMGYFGSRMVEEYVFVDDGQEVDPAWGFAGSAFCALAIILWMRPDGDKQMARITDAVGNIAGGAA